MIREACFKITEECPCNCTFCDSNYKYKEVLKQKIMDLGQWKVICDKLIEQGISAVVISGGEPLLHVELTLSVVDYLRKNGVYVVLNTSGVLFKDVNLLEKVIHTLPNLIVFSVDSYIGEKHDLNRRMPGLFERMIHSIRYFKEKSDISVGIRTVITKNNFRELPNIITFFGELGIDCIKLTNIENDVDGLFRLDYDELVEFNEIIRPEMCKAIHKICQSEENLEINVANIAGLLGNIEDYATISEGLFSPTYTGNRKCCLNGHFVTIQSNGDILPCCEAEHHYYPILGNLLRDEIKTIISSDVYNKFLNNRLEYCTRCTQNLNYQLSFTESTRTVERR